jgi:ABC-type multidrug transport system ATPase subunit
MGDVERLADRFGIVVSGRLVAVFTRREFADRLADRGLLRLRVDRVRPLDESRLREIAAEAPIEESEIVIRCPASSRAAAIDAVRNAGMTIESLTTEEPRLDALYRELVGEHS